MVGNLLQNAAKFTELGGRISVSLATNDNLRQAVFRVRDTGVGIGADMLPRIFEPFAQAETTLARSKGGLGLALVKALVEMHGGNVTVESDGPGRGAEFVMSLSFDGVAPQPFVATAPDSVRPQRILIIEDNFDAATSLGGGLERQRLKPYQKFARMIERHWDGIATYCHPENKVSLGLVEGLNNKIRVLQRRAYGYRDEDYLKLKPGTHDGQPLPGGALR